MAKPASSIVASCRVNTTRSARPTLPPEVLPFLPTFSWIETTSRLRLSSAVMAACSVAASTELRISRPVAVSRATYTNEGITYDIGSNGCSAGRFHYELVASSSHFIRLTLARPIPSEALHATSVTLGERRWFWPAADGRPQRYGWLFCLNLGQVPGQMGQGP